MRKPVLKSKMPKKERKAKTSGRILAPHEPAPFKVENQNGRGVGLVICDHASCRVPRSLKGLGIKKKDLKKHIGWDIGAGDASRYIGRALDMPVILASYSRLVTDLNRAPHYRECMAEVSDHIAIPANRDLSRADKQKRLKELFWPYQKEITRQIDRLVHKKQVPLLIAVHSYTPKMDGIKRPWHIAILWNKENKIAKKIIQEIRKNHPQYLVGENEPYTLLDERFDGSTIWRHGEERNIPYVFIEFRQDLINTKAKAKRWSNIILQAIQPVLNDPAFFKGRKIK